MLYVIYAEDMPDSLKQRLANRPEHLRRLHQLRDEGRLILAGPLPAVDNDEPGSAGFTGSLIVAEFPDLESAVAWAEEDPYRHGGVYRSVSVKPFKRVLP